MNRPLARWRQTSKQPEARAALREVSGVAGRLLTRKTMAEAFVLFREVYIKGAVLPEKTVDTNTREAPTRWISCRGLTTAVAESHSILVWRLLTMINTGIGQGCDSESSVPVSRARSRSGPGVVAGFLQNATTSYRLRFQCSNGTNIDMM